MSIYPIVPTDFKTLKNACRKGLSIEGRIYWWPVMIPVKKDTIISEYPDVEGTAERLTNLVCEFFAGTSSNPTFDWKTDVLMRALEKRKTIERPELLVRLIRIIAECIPQIEVCFLIGCDLLAYPEK